MLIYCRVITEIFSWGGACPLPGVLGGGNSDIEKDTTGHHSEKIPVASKGDSVTWDKKPHRGFPRF